MSTSLSFIKSVLSLHEEMVNNGFSLVYEGEFNHQITKMFTSMAERDMDKTNEEKAVKRRVFHGGGPAQYFFRHGPAGGDSHFTVDFSTEGYAAYER